MRHAGSGANDDDELPAVVVSAVDAVDGDADADAADDDDDDNCNEEDEAEETSDGNSAEGRVDEAVGARTMRSSP